MGQPQTGLGAGQGLLVVPAGNTVTAYGADLTAPTITVDLCDALAMADPQVLTTLRRKQAEIENAIGAYEKRAGEARR